MSKYHLVFEDRSKNIIATYDTDIEPPTVGDIVHLEGPKDQNDDRYLIYNRWYTDARPNHLDITFIVELYDQ